MPPEDFDVKNLSFNELLNVVGAFHFHEDLGYGGRTDRKPLAYNHVCSIILYESRNDLEYPMNEEQWPEHPFLNAATARNFFLDHYKHLEAWALRHRRDKRKLSIALDKIRERYNAIPKRIITIYMGLPAWF